MNLALDQNEGAAGTSGVLADEATPPLNLWLVDDNHNLRDTMKDLLGRCAGIRCTAAFPSLNAVLSALASKSGPDIILLDMHMGNANGLDAIRPIKSLSRSTQVLMFTAFFDSESQTRALSAGASGFLLKSFPIERVLDSIQQANRNPVPHAKRSRVKKPIVRVAAEAPDHDSAVTPKRSLWFKDCLDLFRNRRN